MHMTDSKKVYEQIAHLNLMGTPQVHIAGVVGLSEGRISQILDEPEYKQIEADISATTYVKLKEQNDRWDLIEEQATANILTSLKFNRDPSFNLNAALAANRAGRRGASAAHSGPIIAQQGMRATISLPLQYITNIQNNGGVIKLEAPKEHSEQNRINIMTPGKVESLLGGKQVKENMFAEIDFAGDKSA